MKRCFKCLKVKSLDDFYAHPRMGDGHLNKCKECCKSEAKTREDRLRENPYWVISERARCREKTAKARAAGLVPPRDKTASNAKWNRENRHKRRVQDRLHKAIAKGQIVRENCFCGAVGQAHHPDYSKPLEVMWLCPKHHMEWHVKERERQLLSL